jgi:hypothetical protein
MLKKLALGALLLLGAFVAAPEARAQNLYGAVNGCNIATAAVPAPIEVDPNTGQTCVTGIIANPTSTLTRPANTTAYASGELIANSTTAGSVVVPSFTVPASGVGIQRIRLKTNATTGWGGVNILVTLWGAVAPTYTNGDGGTYAPATTGDMLGQYMVTLNQYGDAASGNGAIVVGSVAALAGYSTLYWDAQIQSAATPISGQTFKLTAEWQK